MHLFESAAFLFLGLRISFVDCVGSALFNSEEFVSIDETTTFTTPPIITHGWDPNTAEIFIGINKIKSSDQCGVLRTLIESAAYPNRLYFGLIEEQHVTTPSCISEYCKPYQINPGQQCLHKDHMTSIALSGYESKGKYYTRHLFDGMMDSQEFCLQVVPQVHPTKNWDVELINVWMAAQNEYAVLSSPLDAPPVGSDTHSTVQHLCQASFNADGNIVSQLPREATNLNRPLLSPQWSGDFSFSKCHADRKTPMDPQHFYLNEELPFTKYARLWTRGYDVYTPHKKILFKTKVPEVVAVNAKKQYQGSPSLVMEDLVSANGRVALLLGYPEMAHDVPSVSSLTRYGLGAKRTLDQLIAFTGIDTRNKKVYENRCQDLQWVPFTADADPRFDASDAWGFGPEMLQQGYGVPLVSGQKTVVYPKDPVAAAAAVGVENDASLTIDVAPKQPPQLGKVPKVKLMDELWWVFQFVDTGVEEMIDYVDTELEQTGLATHESAGYVAVQVFLIIGPVLLGVYSIAVHTLTLTSSGRGDDADNKDI